MQQSRISIHIFKSLPYLFVFTFIIPVSFILIFGFDHYIANWLLVNYILFINIDIFLFYVGYFFLFFYKNKRSLVVVTSLILLIYVLRLISLNIGKVTSATINQTLFVSEILFALLFFIFLYKNIDEFWEVRKKILSLFFLTYTLTILFTDAYFIFEIVNAFLVFFLWVLNACYSYRFAKKYVNL